MKLYTIDDNYIQYLQKYDNHVFNNNNINYTHKRKYLGLGIVISLSKQKYYVPFSSPKQSDYVDANKTIIRKSINPIVRMIKNENGTQRLLGTLKIGNMIPVPDKCVSNYDVNNEPDTFYKNLIIDELDFITRNYNQILTRANSTYKQKITNDTRFNYIKYCCNFELLEQKCIEYQKNQNKDNQK